MFRHIILVILVDAGLWGTFQLLELWRDVGLLLAWKK
jgi:hypothetical protein